MIRRLRRLRHALVTAGGNLWRGRGTTLVTAVAIAVALTMSGIALLLEQQVDRVKGAWYDKAQVTAYLCTADSVGATCNGEPDAARRAALGDLIGEFDGVDAVYFEDRAAAYGEFLERFEGTDIVRTVTPEAIPESFRIAIGAGPERRSLIEWLAVERDIETVQDQRQVLAGFFDAVEKVQVAAIIFAAAQTLGAAALVTSLLRMSLRQRRREVHIMNLIGTPPHTVRAPFLVESMLVTSVGAAISTGALVAVVDYAGPTLTNAGGIRLAPVDTSAAFTISLHLWLGGIAATWLIGRVVLRRRSQQTP